MGQSEAADDRIRVFCMDRATFNRPKKLSQYSSLSLSLLIVTTTIYRTISELEGEESMSRRELFFFKPCAP
jgi:hypothetical protein